MLQASPPDANVCEIREKGAEKERHGMGIFSPFPDLQTYIPLYFELAEQDRTQSQGTYRIKNCRAD